MDNALRITAARDTLEAYKAEKGDSLPIDTIAPLEDQVCWLIADMLHLAAYNNPNPKTPDRVLRMARLYFSAEYAPQEEG